MKERIVRKLLVGVLIAAVSVTQIPYGVLDSTSIVYGENTNLLVNGSFENELNGEWTLTCQNEAVSGNAVKWGVYDGSKSYEIANKDMWVKGYQTPEVKLTQTIEHLTKGTYKYSFNAMGKGGSGAQAIIGGDVKEEPAISFYDWTEDLGKWGSLEYIFTIDKDVNNYEIGVCVPAIYANATYYIDNISLVAIDDNDVSENDTETYYVDVYSEDYSSTTETGWNSNWTDTSGSMTDGVQDNQWKLWTSKAQNGSFTKSFSGLATGKYQLSFVAVGNSMRECKVNVGEQAKDITVNSGGNNSQTVINEIEVENTDNLTVTLNLSFADSGWLNLDDIKLQRIVDKATKIQIEKAELNNIVAACEKLDSKDYTESTWASLQNSLNEAKTLIDKENATVDEITEAKTSLTKAKKNLKEVNKYFVQKIENLREDFIRGVDISSYVSVTESGATYKDADGTGLSDAEFFTLLKNSGVNYVRIRVWNDPYDADKNGYGGGNNDLEKAKTIGKLATDAGMKVLIDFHYSDWWADPSRQLAPKKWKDMTLAEKETALYNYTKDSLTELFAAGVDVAMVQVGNETNNGIAGVSRNTDGWEAMCKLFSAGSKAVREAAETQKKEIQVALHFTDPQTKNWYNEVAAALAKYEVDYDVFASSYYPDIHGSMENITDVLQQVATKYNKKVMVAETAWSWTTEDGDGNGSGFNPGKDVDYAVSIQGQINELRDVMNAVNSIENNAGIGVFYWEPAWIPVQYAYDENGKLDAEIYKTNQEKWEKFGSGWASRYSQSYDPDNGKYYGGSVKDDQAFFDFEGNPLASLTTFKDVYTGVTGNKVSLEIVKNSEAEVLLETADVVSALAQIKESLPDTVTGVYNDSSKKQLPVTWNDEDIAKIDSFGTFSISGNAMCDDGITESVTCSLTVLPNTILDNSGFEDGNKYWTVGNASKVEIKWDDTPLRGEGAMHFYSASNMYFTISQNVTVTKAGKYVASMQLQGGNGSDQDDISIKLVNKTSSTSEKKNAKLNGWKVWQNPCTDTVDVNAGDEVEVVVTIKAAAGAWGSVDDVFLYKVGDVSNSGNSDSSTVTPSAPSAPNDTNTDTKDDNKKDDQKDDQKDVVTEEKNITATTPSGKKVEATVTVSKDKDGNVTEASAKVAGAKAAISAEVAKELAKAAGTDRIAITASVTDKNGNEKYTVTVDSKNLTANKKLHVVAVDPKTGEYKLVNAKTYKVGKDGTLNVKLADGADYKMLTAAELKAVEKSILKTVEVKKSSVTVKNGKKTQIQLSSALDMDNVKSITYKTSKKSVAAVSKSGKITTNKKGTVTIKAIVTLKNGKKKTVSMTLKVK